MNGCVFLLLTSAEGVQSTHASMSAIDLEVSVYFQDGEFFLVDLRAVFAPEMAQPVTNIIFARNRSAINY